MSRPVSLVIPPEHIEYVLGCTDGGTRADRKSNGTYITMLTGEIDYDDKDYLHAVSLLYKNINHELLIRGLPSFHLAVRMNDGLDILGNVLDLPTLDMERD